MVLLSTLSLQWTRYVCVIWVLLLIGNVVLEEVYLNKIAVHVKGGHHAADRVAREARLHNLGQVFFFMRNLLFKH
jgi:hypothetical protein